MPARSYPLTAIGTEKMIPVPVSFETNGLGTLKLPTMPYRYKCKSLKSVVKEDIAATDAATITVKNGATTIGTITIAASAQIGDEDSAPTVDSDVVIETTEQLSLVMAKTTAGGRAVVYLTVQVLPSH